MKTGDSGESGTKAGCAADDRETTLPLLLSPVSRTSQWSDTDELVEPNEKDPSAPNETKHDRVWGRHHRRPFHQFREGGVEAASLDLHRNDGDDAALLRSDTVK